MLRICPNWSNFTVRLDVMNQEHVSISKILLVVLPLALRGFMVCDDIKIVVIEGMSVDVSLQLWEGQHLSAPRKICALGA
jgi:hypothetical protein